MRDHRKLRAFELADRLVLAIYPTYQLSIAQRLGYLEPKAYEETGKLCIETLKVLNGLLRALRN